MFHQHNSCFLEEGNVKRTKDGFSKDVYELDFEQNSLDIVSTMKTGRDLRNKIMLHEDKIYIIGGPQYICEVYNYIDKKWIQIKSYERLMMKDSLDSWACTCFVNFPKIQTVNQAHRDYLSDYYSNNEPYSLQYYHDSEYDDHEIYDDMELDVDDSELSMSTDY